MFKVEYCVALNSYNNTTTILENYNFDSIRFYAKNTKLAPIAIVRFSETVSVT